MTYIARMFLIIGLLLFPLFASADTLTTPISKTETTYTVTYVAFSLSGNVMTVDVELRAADNSLVEKKTIVCDGTCYPSAFAITLKTQVVNQLKTLGYVN